MPEGFAPIAGQDASILLLGTMPSVASLEKMEYYGHPRNAFWTLLYGLWGRVPEREYDKRTAFVQEKKIALWDVLRCCERKGSADASIRREEANDFAAFAREYPEIRCIFFNSSGAALFYQRLVRPDPFAGLPQTVLPSSSPARAMRFEDKLALWRPVREAWESLCGPAKL